eukprot:668691-Pleurochrysis_carterae.AAC.2
MADEAALKRTSTDPCMTSSAEAAEAASILGEHAFGAAEFTCHGALGAVHACLVASICALVTVLWVSGFAHGRALKSVCARMCLGLWVWLCSWLCAWVCECAWVCVCVGVRVCVRVRVPVCVCVRVGVRIFPSLSLRPTPSQMHVSVGVSAGA